MVESDDLMPQELRSVLDRARQLTLSEARELSRSYDLTPTSPAGAARAAADRAAKSHGVNDRRIVWLSAAGSAIRPAQLRAQTGDDFDYTQVETWRWATQALLDAARAYAVRSYISTAEFAELLAPWRRVIGE